MISTRLSGTITASRFFASSSAPNSPAHSSRVARRQLDVLLDALLRLRHGRAEVAAAHAVFQRNEALAVLAIDVGGAALELDLGDVTEREYTPALLVGVGQRHRNAADGVDIVAVARREPHREREVHLALVDACHLLAADRRLHHGVDVADREAVARRLGAVDPHHEVGLAEQVERRRIGDARHLGELVLHRVGQPLQLGEIAAENLHRVLALHAGHRLLDVVLDVLREVEVDAEELALAAARSSGGSALPWSALRAIRSCGLSGTKNSARNEPSGSVPSSPRPCSEATVRTGSKLPITLRMRATVSMPASRVMVGGITARIHMLPSSSLGRNSVPSRAPQHAAEQEEHGDHRRRPGVAHRARQNAPDRLCGCPAPGRSRPPGRVDGSSTEHSTGVMVKVAMMAPISA